MNRYVDEFLSLRSAPDILATVGHLGNKPQKEITEAMGIIKYLKRIVIKEPGKYQVVDLCSGNALVPVIAVHLFPISSAIAIDKLKRERNWKRAERFVYLQMDINDIDFNKLSRPTILTAVHSCKNMAEKTIEIYNTTPIVKHMILMPCCIGNLDTSLLRFIKQEAGNDLAWVTKLALQCKGKVKVGKDNFVMSPKRYIITASKEE